MKIPTLFELSGEPRYTFSYAIGCYPTLRNPQLTKSPLAGVDVSSIKEKLKEPDESGRFQVLGIYQQRIYSTDEERAEQLRNEKYVDLVIKEGGKADPMQSFDHLHRDLILVAYQDRDENEFQNRVKRKLSKDNFEKRERLLGTLNEVTAKLIGQYPREEKKSRDMSLEEHMKWYFGSEDNLRRLSIHHIDNLPNVLQKDTLFIRNFYKRVQGKDFCNLGEYLDETLDVFKKAAHTKNNYGLTRDEVIPLEGSVDNIIAYFKGEEFLQKLQNSLAR